MAGKSKKRRVRLNDTKKNQSVAAMSKARDESYRNAPRKANGKVVPGYGVKRRLEGYREMGREPTVLNGVTPLNGPRVPLFVQDPKLRKKVIKGIKKGFPYITVCRSVGIHYKTFLKWLDRGKAGVSEDYIKFYEAVAKAEAKAEMDQLEKLRLHERADWRVSAWQLERRWPEHWSKTDRVTAEMTVNTNVNVNTKEQLGNSVLEDETARDLARKMIDGNEFGYTDVTPETEDA